MLVLQKDWLGPVSRARHGFTKKNLGPHVNLSLLMFCQNKLEMKKIIRTKDQVEKLLLKELEIKKEYNYYQNHLSKYSKK